MSCKSFFFFNTLLKGFLETFEYLKHYFPNYKIQHKLQNFITALEVFTGAFSPV